MMLPRNGAGLYPELQGIKDKNLIILKHKIQEMYFFRYSKSRYPFETKSLRVDAIG